MDAPFLDLRAADGATARLHLDGAQVTSWIPAGETDDRLFVSARAEYGRGKSVRGGIPICFPQFGPFGALPQHGFARTTRWVVADDAAPAGTARVVLLDADVARDRPAAECAAWPYRFRAELRAQVGGNALEVTLDVTNTGDAPFAFTAALHPYFAVRDAFACEVHGLHGLRYRDALRDGAILDEHGSALAITGPLDRVYYAAPDRLELREPHRTLRLMTRGFPDAVVWNPGAAGTSSRRDFVPGDETHMLCVEAGAIGAPVTLAPGASWSGTQRMEAVATSAR